jgi:hypothetical protein
MDHAEAVSEYRAEDEATPKEPENKQSD